MDEKPTSAAQVTTTLHGLIKKVQSRQEKIDKLNITVKPTQLKIAKLQGEIDGFKDELISLMNTNKIDAHEWNGVKVVHSKKDVWSLKDFKKMCIYVKKTGNYEVFRKQFATEAVKELFTDKDGKFKPPVWVGRFIKHAVTIKQVPKK